MGNQTNLTIALCKEKSESIDGKIDSKARFKSKQSHFRGNVFDRANSTQTIIDQSTHLDHSTCGWTLINRLLQGIKLNVSGGKQRTSGPFKQQSIPRNLTFYFHNQLVLCQRFLLAQDCSWVLLRAKWFWSRKTTLFIGLRCIPCTLFGTGFSCRFQKIILGWIFPSLVRAVPLTCKDTAHVPLMRENPRTVMSRRFKAVPLTCNDEIGLSRSVRVSAIRSLAELLCV